MQLAERGGLPGIRQVRLDLMFAHRALSATVGLCEPEV